MCMFDDGDGAVEMIGQAWHVARQDHKCLECARVISRGERYYRERYKFDGSITNHKTCAHCMVARGWLQDECGGWLYRGVEEDIREHAHNGGYPMGVHRLAVGMAWKWRAPSGKMLPIPKLPLTTHEAQGSKEGG